MRRVAPARFTISDELNVVEDRVEKLKIEVDSGVEVVNYDKVDKFELNRKNKIN
jgi:hypothetical protein